MVCSWHYLFSCFDPIAFSFGSFAFYWYALFFLGAWLCAFLAARLILEREKLPLLDEEELFDLCFWVLVGALVGGRFGYALFYYPSLFLEHPELLVWPFDRESGEWRGIAGMSYHGGLIGVALSAGWWARQKKKPLWRIADLVVLVMPVAVFLGRLGNFFNQELPGRATTLPWGIFFPETEPLGLLRHPVMLYEALGEGLFLFLVLLVIRRYFHAPGSLFIAYLLGYGSIRFLLEFLREPDPQIGFLWSGLTLGQLFSLGMLGCALGLWFYRRKYVTINNV